MSHNQRVKTNLSTVDRLIVDGAETKPGLRSTLEAGITRSKLSGEVVVDELTIPSTAVTITDATTSGGYGSLQILTFPASQLTLLGIVIDLTLAADVNIAADATVAVALGTAAEAADSTLDGTSGDLVASATTDLVTSAGSNTTLKAAAAVLDASAGTVEAHLNFGIGDADISDDDTLTISGIIRLIYVDLSQGA